MAFSVFGKDNVVSIKSFKMINRLTDALGTTRSKIVGVANSLQLTEASRTSEKAFEKASQKDVNRPLDGRQAVQQGKHVIFLDEIPVRVKYN